MSEELAPCPFCGEAATVRYWGVDDGEHYTSDTLHRDHYVECDNDDCGSSPGAINDETWNQRPIEDALRVENERLRKLVRDAEWAAGDDSPEWMRCPWCDAHRKDGHTEDCAARLIVEGGKA